MKCFIKNPGFTVYNTALDAEEIASEQKRTDTRLSDAIAEAEALLDKGGFTAETTAALQKAVDEARAVEQYAAASAEQIDQAVSSLLDAVEQAVSSQSGGKGSAYDTMEAEKYSDWSGGALKTETSQDNTGGGSVGNLGGTYDGAWLKYDDINFGSTGAESFTVRYAYNAGRCGRNSRVDIYLDSMDGEPGSILPFVAVIRKCVQPFIHLKDQVSAASAVSAVRSAVRDVQLPAETAVPVSALAAALSP